MNKGRDLQELKNESERIPEKTTGAGTGSWVVLILSLLYGVSPLDLSPDAVPVLGWLDDVIVVGVGMLNFVQHWSAESNEKLSRIVKLLKRLLIVGGVVVCLLLAVLILLGIRIFG
ncbi:MAG: DUF1232 domain-containing protein [Paludibacteraceae bacterium]|nr:DUF1232 domain-containing protein [Paludibacteraceae bacterium]